MYVDSGPRNIIFKRSSDKLSCQVIGFVSWVFVSMYMHDFEEIWPLELHSSISNNGQSAHYNGQSNLYFYSNWNV